VSLRVKYPPKSFCEYGLENEDYLSKREIILMPIFVAIILILIVGAFITAVSEIKRSEKR